MEHLLSGLFGALIATILSVVYLYISEKARLRADVLLQLVDYCDDIYTHLRDIHTYKDAVYTNKKMPLTSDEYRKISRELTVLLTSSKTGAKLAIVYGKSDTMAAYNMLRTRFLEVSSLLRSATQDAWNQESIKINNLFSKTIDPLRSTIEIKLVKETHAHAIISGFVKYYMPTFYSFYSRFRRSVI